MVHFLDDSTRAHSPLIHNLPGVREWRTKDLFRRHPTQESLWQFAGRVDDIIVLSNGYKFNPVTAESVIQDHPLVSGALIIGLGRAQAALLIELKADQPHAPGVVDMIWPVIEKANSGLPRPRTYIADQGSYCSGGEPFLSDCQRNNCTKADRKSLSCGDRSAIL